ncbi:MAG: homoserine O-acetyltransferase [Nitrospirae bacterium]|nr:MAG: homoserine O-acetyltransferase [Nitrospirota bacterium]
MAKGRTPEDRGVGLVETRYAELFTAEEPLRLDSGASLGPVTLAYETYGELDAARANAVLICHALSGDAHVAGYHEGDDRPGWWDGFVGPGRAIDTDHHFVICSNVIGGCGGSTGPASINPATGRPYGPDFPMVTVGDMVRAQAALLDHLGIPRLRAVVGGSVGGMQALEWALAYPERVESCVVIASTTRLSAQNIAFNAVSRQAIMTDPDFHGGRYYDHGVIPRRGLAVARMMAHITYLSEEGLQDKFGRTLQDRDRLSYAFDRDFAVESYLHYQGSKFVERFDANTYLYFTKAMDYFDPFPDEAAAARRLAPVEAEFLVCAFSSDWRFHAARSKELVRILLHHRKHVAYQEFTSAHGHDSFLLDVPAYKATLKAFLDRRAGVAA